MCLAQRHTGTQALTNVANQPQACTQRTRRKSVVDQWNQLLRENKPRRATELLLVIFGLEHVDRFLRHKSLITKVLSDPPDWTCEPLQLPLCAIPT